MLSSTSAAAGGIAAFAFADDIKGMYEAVERSGRVVAGLIICINEYVPLMALLAAEVIYS